MVTTDIWAPIVPGVSLGGWRLRDRLIDVQEEFLGLGVAKPGTYRLVAPFQALYTVGRPEVEVAVDVRNGKIFKLVARRGYGGLLFGTIRVGMSVADAMAADSRLYYDEAEGLLFCKGTPGVALDVPGNDALLEEVAAEPVDAISVSIPELQTLDAQRGVW